MFILEDHYKVFNFVLVKVCVISPLASIFIAIHVTKLVTFLVHRPGSFHVVCVHPYFGLCKLKSCVAGGAQLSFVIIGVARHIFVLCIPIVFLLRKQLLILFVRK